MSNELEQFQELRSQLHEVNEEWSRASAGLQSMPPLNDEQRRKVGDELRALEARWEDVTRRINGLLHVDGAYLEEEPK